MIRRKKPLKRSTKPIPRRTPKRKGEDALYSKLRKVYLEKYPYCQYAICEFYGETPEQAMTALRQEEIAEAGGFFPGTNTPCPLATSIHHRKKPKKTYLNAVTTWMGVGNEGHRAIEDNLALARQKGYAFNI